MWTLIGVESDKAENPSSVPNLCEGNMPIKTFPQESDKHIVVTHIATAFHLKYMSQVWNEWILGLTE